MFPSFAPRVASAYWLSLLYFSATAEVWSMPLGDMQVGDRRACSCVAVSFSGASVLVSGGVCLTQALAT